MRRVLLLVSVFTLLADVAGATPQLADTIVFGGRKYVFYEVPMLGLWDFEETRGFRVGSGRQKPPPFQVVSTGNWDGYEAQFEIRDSKLFLRRITGYIDGQERENEEILTRKKFPLQATWFTGRIHIGLGDMDEESGEMTAVIVFEVEKGIVKSMSFKERMKPVFTWNGLPEVETDIDQGDESERQ